MRKRRVIKVVSTSIRQAQYTDLTSVIGKPYLSANIADIIETRCFDEATYATLPKEFASCRQKDYVGLERTNVLDRCNL